MEKALIVVLDVSQCAKKPGSATSDAVTELNQHLAEGWRVKHSYAMGGHWAHACLV